MHYLCHIRTRWAWLLLLASLACERGPRSVTESPQTRGERASEAAGRAATPKVAFLGDSIAAGLDLPAAEAFPAQLAARLASEGLPFQLINAGVSGDTSAGGLRRVDWLLRQAPAIVVLELGGNDGLRGTKLSSIEANLRATVAKIKARGVRVLLLGMRIPPSYGAEYAEEFAALYPRVAAAEQVPFVPFFMEGVAGDPALNLGDGLHPNREGHARLAERLVPALSALLRQVRSERDDAGAR